MTITAVTLALAVIAFVVLQGRYWRHHGYPKTRRKS